MSEKLLIVGAGGHGRCCLDIARENNVFDEISFLDDQNVGALVNDAKVIDSIDSMEKYAEKYQVFIAVGNNALRKKLMKRAEEAKMEIVSLVSDKSVVSTYATIGNGSVVFPGAVIEANAQIGEGCIITSNATINHDAIVEEYSLVYSNSVIRPNAVVGTLAKIGSQCVVTFGKKVETGTNVSDGEII